MRLPISFFKTFATFCNGDHFDFFFFLGRLKDPPHPFSPDKGIRFVFFINFCEFQHFIYFARKVMKESILIDVVVCFSKKVIRKILCLQFFQLSLIMSSKTSIWINGLFNLFGKRDDFGRNLHKRKYTITPNAWHWIISRYFLMLKDFFFSLASSMQIIYFITIHY